MGTTGRTSPEPIPAGRAHPGPMVVMTGRSMGALPIEVRRPCPGCGEEMTFAPRSGHGPQLGRCGSCANTYTLFGGKVEPSRW